MAGHQSAKIVELDDFSDESEEFSNDFDDSDNVPLKFKASVLKNKRMFQKQLLDVSEIDPNSIFEVCPSQENDGDQHALMMAMEQQTIPLPNENIEGDKLVYLSKSMEPVSGYEDGVYKKVIVDGVGTCPPVDSIVSIHYNAYVEDEASGEIISFDSTVLRGKTRTFLRGQGRVIAGLDIAVGTMKSKEQSEFTFSPHYAFGSFGCPPRIPGNAYVYFRVELIEWIDSCQAEAYCKLPKAMQKEAPFQQTLDAVQSQKSKAKAFLDKQNFPQAALAYKQALHWIEDRGYANEEEEKRGMKESLALYLDLALVFLKLGRPIKTRTYCQEALNIDPKNAKGLYRLGLAEQKLGNHMEARCSFLSAKKILPNDSCINKALHELNTQIESEEFIEKNLYRKMMGALKLEKQNAAASVSDDFKVLLEKEFKYFMDDPSRTHMNFPYGMSASERAYLELESKRLNLKFSIRPSLKGEDIFVVQK